MLPMEVSQSDRMWAALVHLTIFLGLVFPLLPFAGLIAVLVIRAMVAESPFLKEQCAGAFNFQLTAWLGFAALFAVATAIADSVGGGAEAAVAAIGFAVVVGLLALPVVAAVRASRGIPFRYRFVLPVLR